MLLEHKHCDIVTINLITAMTAIAAYHTVQISHMLPSLQQVVHMSRFSMTLAY